MARPGAAPWTARPVPKRAVPRPGATGVVLAAFLSVILGIVILLAGG
ncbi:MAG: hypothetical protein Q4C85_10165 [Actinomyces sp.]|nr:hypothetical protein [Actinomyces sp.]MDO4244101.1 hypothetical protein [Actinomyces sp.]